MNLAKTPWPVWIAILAALAIVPTLSIADTGEACGKLASVQNDVETRKAATETWQPSTRDERLYAQDRVRTGAASRAAILYSDQTLHRINEKSEIEILPPDADNPGVLRVLSGQHYFSSRTPKDYGRIETPTVTAAIRGTEFVVDTGADGTTTITMLEGVVDASNAHGELRVTTGEAAYVQPGKAPVKRIVVRPRDAVAWSLYYPRVLGGADAGGLESLGPDGEELIRAADLLYAGQVSAAAPLIEQVRERSPQNPIALALSSVIDVAADRKEEAMDKARRAREADPNSAAAALALSFAYQATFDIAKAREAAEAAVGLDPASAEAQARVAELRMAEGDTEGARVAAEEAVRRDSSSVRAVTVLGFVELAELRTPDALASFGKAVQLDPSFPLARLGHGIAMFREDLVAGREALQTAVILDPEDSLLRSYLAKAYYEENRPEEAAKELAAAKELDPSDPTPYLYDAILKRTYNRPVEALADLQRSIELNDNRAVYRSRMLLDEDLAVRSADLAGIYNDLGFDQLGMVTARRSADLDQSNHSAHLFLAGTYRNLAGFAPAFLSETLQARIYQPVSVNAVRPDVVNESVSFNEYTALFDRPRMRVFAGASYGRTDDDIYPDGDCTDPFSGAVVPCDSLEAQDSNLSAGEVTLTLNRDRFAGALAYRRFRTDGFRVNNDDDAETLRGFFVYAPTRKDQFQLNVIDGNRVSGDLPLRLAPRAAVNERIETDLTNIGLGYHRILSPAADLAISAIYSDAKQVGGSKANPRQNVGTFDGGQLEAQYVLRQERLSWTAGAGRFDGEQEIRNPSTPESSLRGDDEFTNAYVYAKFPDLGRFSVVTGLAWEDVVAPVGILPPRDALFDISDLTYEDHQFSGKFGLSYQAAAHSVVRITAYQRLAPAIGRLQTLEPTQVSGFNQFYNDQAGTSSFNYGLGYDREVGSHFFAGMSLLRRELEIPEPFCSNPDPFVGCGANLVDQPLDVVVERESKDLLGNLYMNGTIGKRVATSVEYAYERRVFDFTQKNNIGQFEEFLETHRIRPQARLFLPMGFYASVRGTHFDQRVDQYFLFNGLGPSRIKEKFWIGDLELGYRLPDRLGSVSLRLLNFNDQEFDFFRSSLEENILPARTILLALSFTSR